MIKPVFTEKSIRLAKSGQYSFWVDPNMAKPEIKSLILKLFKVHVTSIKTIKKAGETGRNAKGRKFTDLAKKKALITIKAGEKLSIFEESKK